MPCKNHRNGAVHGLPRCASVTTTRTHRAETKGGSMAAKNWRTEDWVAVYLGFFIIAVILAAFNWKLFDLGNLRSTFRWTTDAQIAARAPGWTAALEEIAKDAEGKGRKDVAAAAGGLKAGLQKNDRKAIEKSAG